jgi:hypothetical protein
MPFAIPQGSFVLRIKLIAKNLQQPFSVYGLRVGWTELVYGLDRLGARLSFPQHAPKPDGTHNLCEDNFQAVRVVPAALELAS